tara:strand:- start:245 stop:370 length:126 start_codon:yes stop_codon:yes gene_type:complete
MVVGDERVSKEIPTFALKHSVSHPAVGFTDPPSPIYTMHNW